MNYLVLMAYLIVLNDLIVGDLADLVDLIN